MNEAILLREQIVAWYSDGVPSYGDLAQHIKRNHIDRFEPSAHKHTGYDESYDGSMVVFFFGDGSLFIVGPSGISVSE